MSDEVLAQGLQNLGNVFGDWAQRRRDQATSDTLTNAFNQWQAGQQQPGAPAPPPLSALSAGTPSQAGTGSTSDPSQPSSAPPLSYAPPDLSAPSLPAPVQPQPRQPSAQSSPSFGTPGLPSIAGVQGTPSGGGIGDMLNSLNSQYNLPPGYLTRTAGIESNFNVNAYNKGSGASGPFQFVPSTAAQYGVSNPFDWAQSAQGAAQLASDNTNVLRNALGREPTAGELYLAHQQGAGGAAKLLANPTARAGDVLGDAAVASNGGDPNMPAGAFAAKWTSKFPGATGNIGGAPIGTAAPPPSQVGGGAVGPAGIIGLRGAAQQSAASPYGTLASFNSQQGAPQPQTDGSAQPSDPSSQPPPTSAVTAPPAQAFQGATPLRSGFPNLGSLSGAGTTTVPQRAAQAGGMVATDPNTVRTDAQGNALNPDGSPTSSNYNPTTGIVTASGQQPSAQGAPPAGMRPQAQGPSPAMSYAPPQQSPAPVPAQAAIGAATAGQPSTPLGSDGKPYGSTPLMIQGRMLTRQQAQDQLGDHDLYDDAAEDAKLIPDSSNAPPFVDANAGGGRAGTLAVPQSATNGPGVASYGQPASPAPTQSAASPAQPGGMPIGPRTTGIPADAIRTLLSNPDTRDTGMKLWEQAITGKNYGFMSLGDNAIGVTDPTTGAVRIVQGKPKPVTLSAGQSVIDPTNPTQPLASVPASGNDATKKVVQIGEDQFGNKRYGIFDTSTSAITPLNADGTPATPAPSGAPPDPGIGPAPTIGGTPGAGVMNLHGADFLATLDPATAGQVQAIVEGRAPYPTGMMLKTPYGQRLATYVTQTDPTFESGNAENRNRVRSDFEAGGQNGVAGSITAANTAIGHLGELSDAAQQLNNTRIPLVNSIGNSVSTAFGGNAVTNFNNIVGKYVEEATKVYRGTGGTESDIARDIGNLSPDMSPAQLNSAIQIQANLMRSKVDALQQRWRQGMGPLVPDFPIIQPKSAQVLGVIGQRAGIAPQPQSAPQAPQQGARVQIRSAADYQALPSGTRYLDPNGTPRIKP